MAKVQRVYWRKFIGRSPIGESAKDMLAKVHWKFANWRKYRGYIGESSLDVRQWRKSNLQNSYWRTSGNPVSGATMMLTFHLSKQNFQMISSKFTEVNQNKVNAYLLPRVRVSQATMTRFDLAKGSHQMVMTENCSRILF